MKVPFLALLVGLAASPAHALYCNDKLISEGDPSFKVRVTCGDPIQISRYVIYETQAYPALPHPTRFDARSAREIRNQPYELQTVVPIEIEEWTYNFGRERFLHRVIFQNGYLKQIETAGYGF